MVGLYDILKYLSENKNEHDYEGVDFENKNYWLCIDNKINSVTQFIIYNSDGGKVAYAELIEGKDLDESRYEHFIKVFDSLVEDREAFLLELEYQCNGLI